MGTRSSTLTMEEVERHSSKEDAWLVLFGEAIDVTNFLGVHPGGEETLSAYFGKDATQEWQQIHTPDALERYAEHLSKKGRVATGGLFSWIMKKMMTPGGSYSRRPLIAKGEQEVQDETEGASPSALEPKRWSAEHESELPPGGSFDLEELKRWDGLQLPMCIGVCGIVLDVSSSENFVPGFGYGKLWAGRDTTWAMSKASLKPDDANKLDFTLEDLEEMELRSLAGWYKHFTEKYRQVGTLREMRDRDFGPVMDLVKQLSEGRG